MDTPHSSDPKAVALRRLLKARWPDATRAKAAEPNVLCTPVAALNRLLPAGGIPFGQQIKISGAPGSGKTGFLLHLLSAVTHNTVLYLDFPVQFFPAAAKAAGVSLDRLRVVRPANLSSGLRIAEQCMETGIISVVVFDLIGGRTPLPSVLAHRFRQRTLQHHTLVFWLTNMRAPIPGPSLVSLHLEVGAYSGEVRIRAVRNRLGPEGVEWGWSPPPVIGR